jgi:hypothetical protein
MLISRAGEMNGVRPAMLVHLFRPFGSSAKIT